MRNTKLACKTCTWILTGALIAGCQSGTVFASEIGQKSLADTLPAITADTPVVTAATEESNDETGLDPAEANESGVSKNSENESDGAFSPASRLANNGMASIRTDSVEAGANDFTIKVTYQTYDPDDDVMSHLPETVEANGETYRIADAKQPLQVSTENVEPKTVAYESEVFTGNESEHEPDEEIEYEDGLKYKLKSKTLNEQTTKERSEYKETVVSYKGVEAGVSVQDTKTVDINDTDTGKTVKAPLKLLDQKVTKEYWDDSFQFEITITGYDADILVLNGKEIPSDSDLMDYRDDLLAILHLDPNSYRIDKIDLQPVEGNSDVRKAIAYGSKYVRNIDATYGGNVTLPSITGKTWNCVYEEEIPENESVIYTMSSTVSFVKGDGTAETKSLLQRIGEAIIGFITAAYEAAVAAFEEHPIITSIPIVLVAAFLVLLITRKVRNRCIYNDAIKCPYKKHNKAICKSCPNYRQRNTV